MHTYRCAVESGEAHPGYEPEEDAAATYGITDIGWCDLRTPTTWNELIQRDQVTYPLLLRLRASLGYG